MAKKDINKTIKLFLDSIKVERGLSKNTLTSYEADLTSLDSYLSKQKPKILLETAKEEDLLMYIKSLKNKSFSEKTQSRQISAIRQLYNFCYQEKIISQNPSINLVNPKIKKSLPKFLTEE